MGGGCRERERWRMRERKGGDRMRTRVEKRSQSRKGREKRGMLQEEKKEIGTE